MSLTSLEYALFLPAVFAVHWLLPRNLRWIALLAASLGFIAYLDLRLLWPVAGVTAVSYAAAIAIGRLESERAKRWVAGTAFLLLLGALAGFKYAGFAWDSGAALARACGFAVRQRAFSPIVPLGISFYTFQAVAYVADVRAGKIPAERHFGRHALAVAFFPKFLAGPIERGGSLLPQLASPAAFSYDRAAAGMRLIALGLFKKAVVADTLGTFVNAIFANPGRFNGAVLALGALFFSIQIYGDFSGYSDIAIGSAKLLGIDLCDNFRAPYFSHSLGEFWRRWHISLSTWFRDYLYIPLGGSRRGTPRTIFNLLATFLASGLWHGADWTFVAWGGLHGAALVAERFAFPPRKTRPGGPAGTGTAQTPPTAVAGFLRGLATFAFVTAAWVFFRADSIRGAVRYLARIATALPSPVFSFRQALDQLHIDGGVALRLLVPVALLAAWDAFDREGGLPTRFAAAPAVFRWCAYALALGFVLYAILPVGASSQDFIYFRF